MDTRFSRAAFVAVGGLLIWAADFLFLYAFGALACARGFDAHIAWVSIAANLIAAAATLVWILVVRRRQGFAAGLAASTAALALIGIAFIALPSLLLSRAC